jgi:uncharacterized peroxidase-related enzyme
MNGDVRAMLDEAVCFVEFEAEDTAFPTVRSAYDGVSSQDGRVANLYKAMSLSPAVIPAADQLYKQTLHNDDCPLLPWLRELIGAQVAIICGSEYAVINHGRNFHDFFKDKQKSSELLAVVKTGSWRTELQEKKLSAILSFSEKLSKTPELMNQDDISTLRNSTLTEKEIVYLVQICASFGYWCRVINALGIKLGDEPIGLCGWTPGE